jgi:hypothetical protein
LIEGRTLELWRRFLDDQASAFSTSFALAHY